MKKVSTADLAASWIKDQLRFGAVASNVIIERGVRSGFARSALYRGATLAGVESLPGKVHRERVWQLGPPVERTLTIQRASETVIRGQAR